MDLKQIFTFKIGSDQIQCDDVRLWDEAGFTLYKDGIAKDNTPYAYRRLARAISEGHTGPRALMRCVALGEEEARLNREMAVERLRKVNHDDGGQ